MKPRELQLPAPLRMDPVPCMSILAFGRAHEFKFYCIEKKEKRKRRKKKRRKEEKKKRRKEEKKKRLRTCFGERKKKKRKEEEEKKRKKKKEKRKKRKEKRTVLSLETKEQMKCLICTMESKLFLEIFTVSPMRSR